MLTVTGMDGDCYSSPTLIERILIANRGEVAVRVARTCRRLGIETVGVHVGTDEGAPHVEACDVGVAIGDDPAAYRNTVALLSVAKEQGVQAVHPGYGLLAEEPIFASEVEAAGLVFVGPAAERFEESRDRLKVRQVAIDAGVRVLPASERPITTAPEALEDVDRLDYPVVVKPVKGIGEPRATYVAHDVADLAEALKALDPLEEHGGCFVERYVELARHVEVQLVYDGNETLVIGDRDVSLRRESRRVLVESPAVAIDQLHDPDAVRGAIWEASTEIASRIGCRGLGSCHFVIDADGVFYFTGFTAGLQVEHPTIEMCANIDLVEVQLHLALGEEIPPELLKVESTGSALQARVDASTDPETGKPFDSSVENARWPPAPRGKVRIETGIRVGSQISSDYDPLVATVTTYAPNRHDALLMLDRILAEIHISPLVTNLRLLRKALNHESLRAGQYDEDFLDRI